MMAPYYRIYFMFLIFTAQLLTTLASPAIDQRGGKLTDWRESVAPMPFYLESQSEVEKVSFIENTPGTHVPMSLVNLKDKITADDAEEELVQDGEVRGKRAPSMKFTVTYRLNAPFIMKNESALEGYAIDLLKEIGKIIGSEFEMKEVADGRYGALDPITNRWTGMIGEVLYGSADLAVCDLTITAQRSAVVDFSTPFMTVGISMFYRKPTPVHTRPWTVLVSPFSKTVWIYTGLTYLSALFTLYIFNRFSSSSKNRTPSKCSCTSFSAPKNNSLPTQLLIGSLYIFSILLIAIYTANLSAILTHDQHTQETPIQSAEDLSRQDKIQYGMLRGGSTASFFQSSSNQAYHNMWQRMTVDPSMFVSTSSEGIDRVLNGNYAFFTESSLIDYILPTHCELMQVGSLLDTKGFAIAFPKDSGLRSLVNKAILQLAESGKLAQLKELWWVTKQKGKQDCKMDHDDGNESPELDMQGMTGLFFLFMVGSAAASMVALGQRCRSRRKTVHLEDKLTTEQQVPIKMEQPSENNKDIP